jgi:hypothetical protein
MHPEFTMKRAATITLLCLALGLLPAHGEIPEGVALRAALIKEADQPSRPQWHAMLLYLAKLHGESVFPAAGHFKYPYESIGAGYQGGRVFGHIDLAHERLDTVRAAPVHVRNQTRNELAGQQADGMIPGVINFDKSGKATWKPGKGFPPFWGASVDAYVEFTSDPAFLNECLAAVQKQITWFEMNRAVPGGGFYYLDLLQKTWESGMDEGIRYDSRPATPSAAVDATSHVFMLYDHAARWSRALGKPDEAMESKAKALQQFIRREMWNEKTGFFYDSWSVRQPEHMAFEGMWPVVVGAATTEQAKRVIEEHLLNRNEFFAPHPISTVAMNDPKFELRMWRGPAWNCMTYWAARGCFRYGHKDAARKLLEAALDTTATIFERTGTLWEFYDPHLGDQKSLHRKSKGRPIPCEDYIGHNPLFAMVDLWRRCGAR